MQFLSREGVQLAYVEKGDGGPPLLFIHGWCCDHSYFAPQAGYFSSQHRVVSVDLRGHGASDKPADVDYTMALFADDLAWTCEQVGLDRPVLIGHSLGGVVAFELTLRHPDLARGVVSVDAPLVRPEAMVARLSAVADDLRTPEYLSATRRFVGNMFLPGDDAARKAQIIDGMANAPQHVMVSAFQNMLRCDTDAALAGWSGPALVIAARPADEFTRLAELCPQAMVGVTVGTGHFNQLEAPDQVNAMIERFLAIAF